MSEENVEKLRAFAESWGSREVDLSLLDSDVVYESNVLPDQARETYHGHEGFLRASRTWLEPYEKFTFELERIVGSGNRLVSIHLFRWRARGSGIEGEIRYGYVWTFRDGAVTHIAGFGEPAKALAAAGLSE